MKLNSKHYAAIAGILLVVIIVLISQFPPKEYKPGDYEEQGFFEDTKDFYLNIPNEPLPETMDNNPTEENIPLNFSIETTGCLGEIIDNAFVPDSRNPTEEQLAAKPVFTTGKGSLKIEFYGGMLCKASNIFADAYMDPDGQIVVYEEEEIDADKFIYGPTGALPDEIWPCYCNYKTTINITGLDKSTYPILMETKNNETILSQITIN
ncbi:MAG: hypothetical protein COT90_02550 [Candidatus Diapherotrites archaeon CG10_big_fil_rev_8_21_14_0_10_31_34]|nr:MAG: hypothetical protein COT90_02550 [Candidatus Diapherotrites archaeon CG10_big_fil_rev_8_21_14_0_10_31_34]